jgi:hypothetical protein
MKKVIPASLEMDDNGVVPTILHPCNPMPSAKADSRAF